MANETVICTYRVRASDVDRFVELLRTHQETLRRLELVTEEHSVLYRSLDEPPTFVEIFTWVEGGFTRAHEHPDVLLIWEALDPLLEERGHLPKWDFPHFARVALDA